jgi:6-phosphogluconolactonase
MSDEVIRLSGAAVRAGLPYNIALSGGSTPRLLFRKMAAAIDVGDLWEKLSYFWVDERCVPPDHPDSNYRMTRETFFHPISIGHDRIHRMMGEEEPYGEADRYATLLQSQLPERGGMPRFDLILLGMGADGHTASIFPDQMHLIHTGRVCEVALHPETGQRRITLTGPVINNAERVCFMITGRNKAAVLDRILNDPEPAREYPASHIRPTHGSLEWFLDEDAAKAH